MPEEEKLKPEIKSLLKDLAIIPKDSSLDLLQYNPRVLINTQRSMLNLLEFILEQRIMQVTLECKLPLKIFNLIKYFVIHLNEIKKVDTCMEKLGQYLYNLIRENITDSNQKRESLQIFSKQEKALLSILFEKLKQDELRNLVLKLRDQLEQAIKIAEESQKPFYNGDNTVLNKLIDKNVGQLLIYMNDPRMQTNILVKNSAGVLIFYFSMYKLFHSPGVQKLVSNFIPQRKDKKGNLIRDKNRQIKDLVNQNKVYKQRFLNIIKTIYPLVNKQIQTVIQTFNLFNLVLLDGQKKLNKTAYLKLLGNFIHDVIYSGLSVIVGFHYRPAALAFEKAALSLERVVKGNQPQGKKAG